MRSFFQASLSVAILTLAACGGGRSDSAFLPPAGASPNVSSCSGANCPPHARSKRPLNVPFGFTPSDLANAYAIPASTTTNTVAVVEAFGYRTLASDLAAYRAHFGIPACAVANGCLRIVGQTGGRPPTTAGGVWAEQTSTDIDMVSAVCPTCHILVVQANNLSLAENLYPAIAEARTLGAKVTVAAWGQPEHESARMFPKAFSVKGPIIIASSGSYGGGRLGVNEPCSFDHVVCVGGTSLYAEPGAARPWYEISWNGLGSSYGATGSACSRYSTKPVWQTDTGCKMRSAADISAVSDPRTPVAIYYAGAWVGGGNGAAAIVGGMIASANNPLITSATVDPWIWSHSENFNDVTYGTNLYSPVTGPCASNVAYICSAGVGYDGPTGWGTPNGLAGL
jgi:subtilase family serine protease